MRVGCEAVRCQATGLDLHEHSTVELTLQALAHNVVLAASQCCACAGVSPRRVVGVEVINERADVRLHLDGLTDSGVGHTPVCAHRLLQQLRGYPAGYYVVLLRNQCARQCHVQVLVVHQCLDGVLVPWVLCSPCSRVVVQLDDRLLVGTLQWRVLGQSVQAVLHGDRVGAQLHWQRSLGPCHHVASLVQQGGVLHGHNFLHSCEHFV